MKNTLELDGEGFLDTMADVERTFAIELTDAECERFTTAGQIQDLIETKSVHAGRTTSCLSQTAFYRLRAALRGVLPDADITPRTSVAVIYETSTQPIWQQWKWLAGNAGLDLPMLETPFRSQSDSGPWLKFWMNLAGWLSIIGAMVAVFLLLHILIGFSPIMSIIGTPIVFFGGVDLADSLWRRLYGDIPRRIETIGDLAREVAGINFAKLVAEKNGCSRSDRWSALQACLLTMSGRKDPITRDTTLFAKSTIAANTNA